MRARHRRGSRERIGKRVSMLPGQCPVRPGHYESASARDCKRHQDAAALPAQNSEVVCVRTSNPPATKSVLALRLMALLWFALEIDSMDGQFFPAGMGVPW